MCKTSAASSQPVDADSDRWFRIKAAIVVAAVTGANAAATQTTRSVQMTGFHAPFFLMVMHTSSMALMIPVARLFAKPDEKLLAPFSFVIVVLPLWLASVFFFVDALVFAPAGLVQTIFGTAPAATAVLSYFFLAEPLGRWRKIAVTVAFIGIATIGLSNLTNQDGQGSAARATFGALLTLGAVLASGGYTVSLKVWLPDRDPAPSTVLKFVGTPGLGAALLGFPVSLALSLYGYEERWWEADSNVNWPLVLAGTSVNICYSLFLALGVAVTNPTCIAFGVIAAVPINLFLDAVLRHIQPSAAELVGAVFIIISFGLSQFAAGRSDRDPAEGQRPPLQSAAAAQGNLLTDDDARWLAA